LPAVFGGGGGDLRESQARRGACGSIAAPLSEGSAGCPGKYLIVKRFTWRALLKTCI
jgi:hypothetical protein